MFAAAFVWHIPFNIDAHFMDRCTLTGSVLCHIHIRLYELHMCGYCLSSSFLSLWTFVWSVWWNVIQRILSWTKVLLLGTQWQKVLLNVILFNMSYNNIWQNFRIGHILCQMYISPIILYLIATNGTALGIMDY